MIFRFANVGPVKEAIISLGALTVVCGKNNTGKTYLTNCLYEFYRMLSRKCTVRVQEDISPTAESVSVDLEKYRQAVVEAIQEKAKQFSESASSLHGGSFDVEISPSELPLDYPVAQSTWSSRVRNWKFGVTKRNSVLDVTRRESVNEGDGLSEGSRREQWHAALNTIVNAHLFRQDLNGGYIGDACSMASERMGITYFKDCIDIALRAQSQKADADGEVPQVSNTENSSRSLPLFPTNVYAMLDMISYLGQRKKLGLNRERKYLNDILADLESLTGGKYDVEDSKMVFIPSESDDLSITVQDTSSSVRALFALDMYVRNFAEKGDLLVVDEPEMNLHPEKQRRLARFIAKLVNHGVKVFITTHSDYIIRELNTLIAFSAKNDRVRKIRETEGYSTDEILNASDVKAYVSRSVDGKFVFDNVNVVDGKGIQVAAIDTEIDEMNRIQDLIIWGE